jgi:hypothetical protein
MLVHTAGADFDERLGRRPVTGRCSQCLPGGLDPHGAVTASGAHELRYAPNGLDSIC